MFENNVHIGLLLPLTIRATTKIGKEDATTLVMRITDGVPPPLRVEQSADFSEGKQQPLPLQTAQDGNGREAAVGFEITCNLILKLDFILTTNRV